MNIAPRYLGRGSWLARRDPRVLILVVALFIFTVLQVWDERFVLLLLAIAIVYYRSAGIEWRHIRRNWAFVFVFIGFLVSVNLFVFSGGFVEGLPPGEGHLLFTVPLLGTPVTAESLSLAVTQFTRYLTMATIGFPVAFAIAPSDFGVAFKRLGVPEKFAFGIDLTFRFLPSLAADFQTTVDAQRIRGFDWSAGATGFLSRGRGARRRSSCRPSSTRSPGRRTRSTRWTCGRSARVIDRGCASSATTCRIGWCCSGSSRLLVVMTVLGFLGITSKLYVFPFLLALAGG